MVVFCRPSNSKLFVIVQNPVFTFEYVTCEVSRLKTQRSSLGVSHHVLLDLRRKVQIFTRLPTSTKRWKRIPETPTSNPSSATLLLLVSLETTEVDRSRIRVGTMPFGGKNKASNIMTDLALVSPPEEDRHGGCGIMDRVPSPCDVSLSESSDATPNPTDEGKALVPNSSLRGDSSASDPTLAACRPATSMLGSADPFHLIGHVIGPTNLMELVACPCCQQCFDDLQPFGKSSTSDGKRLSAQAARNRSILHQESGEDDEDDIEDDEDDVLPGVLGAGVHYNPKSILAEGWLHKKGTGRDWMGSRGWKARWARLALATVDGYDLDVPILLIYWYPASSHASTVIVLDSTVVLPVDFKDKDRWNSHRFEIRHVQKQESDQPPLATRTFAAPLKGRDAWVYEISQALLSYEKLKDKHRKLANKHRAEEIVRRSRSPDRSNSPTYDEVWTGDRFVTVELRKPSSPVPGSPSSPSLRSPAHPASPNLPRPKARRPAANGETGNTSRSVSALSRTPRVLVQPKL